VVIPSVLNNVGVAYQRTMVAISHDLIHKFVEVYIDDIIAKYKKKMRII